VLSFIRIGAGPTLPVSACGSMTAVGAWRDHADRTYTAGHLENRGALGLPCRRTKGIWH
jgi:hypothetical protein